MPKFIPVSPKAKIKTGAAKPFTVEGENILLANIDGEFFAIEDQCSQEDSPLSPGCLKGDAPLPAREGGLFLTSGSRYVPSADARLIRDRSPSRRHVAPPVSPPDSTRTSLGARRLALGARASPLTAFGIRSRAFIWRAVRI